MNLITSRKVVALQSLTVVNTEKFTTEAGEHLSEDVRAFQMMFSKGRRPRPATKHRCSRIQTVGRNIKARK